MDKYLFQIFTEDTKYVNYSHPAIKKKIQELFNDGMTELEKAQKAYYFVRDRIGHSFDIGAKVVSITASDVLQNGTGICHAKSNLLVALLRSQGIPAEFSLGESVLAFPIREEWNEYHVAGIFARPNMTSMRYLESLEELDPYKYADWNKVEQKPDILL